MSSVDELTNLVLGVSDDEKDSSKPHTNGSSFSLKPLDGSSPLGSSKSVEHMSYGDKNGTGFDGQGQLDTSISMQRNMESLWSAKNSSQHTTLSDPSTPPGIGIGIPSHKSFNDSQFHPSPYTPPSLLGSTYQPPSSTSTHLHHPFSSSLPYNPPLTPSSNHSTPLPPYSHFQYHHPPPSSDPWPSSGPVSYQKSPPTKDPVQHPSRPPQQQQQQHYQPSFPSTPSSHHHHPAHPSSPPFKSVSSPTPHQFSPSRQPAANREVYAKAEHRPLFDAMEQAYRYSASEGGFSFQQSGLATRAERRPGENFPDEEDDEEGVRAAQDPEEADQIRERVNSSINLRCDECGRLFQLTEHLEAHRHNANHLPRKNGGRLVNRSRFDGPEFEVYLCQQFKRLREAYNRDLRLLQRHEESAGTKAGSRKGTARPAVPNKVVLLEEAKKVLTSMDDVEFNKLRETTTCPLSRDLFKDPVKASDGRTYEREWIEDYFDREKKSYLNRLSTGFQLSQGHNFTIQSPMTRANLELDASGNNLKLVADYEMKEISNIISMLLTNMNSERVG